MSIQSLEGRRLLAAEGGLVNLSSSVDASGLVGEVTADVRWGDGTTSAATVQTPANASVLRVRFDYSLDRGFFSGANVSRRALLELAADSLVDRFGDDLAAIVPGGLKQWQPSIFHPSSGTPGQLSGTLTPLSPSLSIGANEIVVYVGARDLPGNNRGVAGGGSYQFPAVNITCRTQAECDQKIAEINAFRTLVRARGEAGAVPDVQTDTAPSLGSISFDTGTNWYFGIDAEAIQPDQVDFLSVAIHEMAHILGFGMSRTDVVTSWKNLTASGVFTGAAARAAYEGSGNVPVESTHWAESVVDQVGQETLMADTVPSGRRQLFTPLDYAAMDDLGWDLLPARVTVTAQHRYADNGSYPQEVVLRGNRVGELSKPVGRQSITNVAPTLTTVGHQTTTAGKPLQISNLGTLTDPGFSNPLATPATVETFDYSIDWGDGTTPQTGSATIDRQGDFGGNLTLASFDGAHTYASAGTYVVRVNLKDDDGGAASGSFTVDVQPAPLLPLAVSLASGSIGEGDANGTQLRIDRGDADTSLPLTVNLTGGNVSDLIVPATFTIPAGAKLASVTLTAVDDALPELTESFTLTVSASGFIDDSVTLEIVDDEPPLFQNPALRLDVNNSGTVTANDALQVINQLARLGGTATLDPETEQPAGTFYDTNGDYQISALDALLVINELGRLRSAQSSELLKPPVVDQVMKNLSEEDAFVGALV